MNELADVLGKQASDMLERALERAAERLVDERLYTGTEAVEFFQIPRSALAKIVPTYLNGRRKPKYAAKHIKNYLSRRHHHGKSSQKKS